LIWLLLRFFLIAAAVGRLVSASFLLQSLLFNVLCDDVCVIVCLSLSSFAGVGRLLEMGALRTLLMNGERGDKELVAVFLLTVAARAARE